MAAYSLCFILFCTGLYAVLCKRNMIKIILGLAIIGYALNLFFVILGSRQEPVDKLPQALVAVSIIIGLAVTAFLCSLAARIYEKYGTLDIEEIKKLKG